MHEAWQTYPQNYLADLINTLPQLLLSTFVLTGSFVGGWGSGSQGSHHAQLASTPWSYVALPLWFCTDSRFGYIPPDQQETLGYRLMAKVQIVLDRFGGKSETTRWQATAKVNGQLARREYRLPDFVT